MRKVVVSAIAASFAVGLVSASAWGRVDPFAPIPVTPPPPTPSVTLVAEMVTVPVSGARTMVVMRPVVVAPARPPLISPIR